MSEGAVFLGGKINAGIAWLACRLSSMMEKEMLNKTSVMQLGCRVDLTYFAFRVLARISYYLFKFVRVYAE